MKAAVFHGAHKPLTIENVDIGTPIKREVLVRTVASGVCHSDLHFVDGYYPFPTPAILRRVTTSSRASPCSAARATTA